MQQETVREVFCKGVSLYGLGWLGGMFNQLLQPHAAVVQRSDEWFKQRDRFYVTCSTIAQAIGIGYDSRIKLYEEKVLGKRRVVNPTVQSWIDYGVEHEKDGLRQYALLRLRNNDFQENGFILTCGTLINACDNFSGSPDGIWIDTNTLEATLLEVKVPNPDMGTIPDEVPPMYLTQVLGLMRILNLPKCHFIYWTKNMVRVFEIEFNPAAFAKLIPFMDEFREYCELGKIPPSLPRGRKKTILDILEKVDQRILTEFEPL